jgi:glutaredoxin 3
LRHAQVFFANKPNILRSILRPQLAAQIERRLSLRIGSGLTHELDAAIKANRNKEPTLGFVMSSVSMQPVTIYTTRLCPYCQMAKELLTAKGVPFKEISAERYEVRDALRLKAGGRTSVPQIWIGDHHVGGCDDLHALDARGRLDVLLAG